MVKTGHDTPEKLLELYEEEVKDHLASLRYAGLIQKALLPDPLMLKSVMRDLFVVFLPRDIVSGDFYYAFASRDITCIAAGDCTGHGVPGALLSILGISFLNEMLQSSTVNRANRILNRMREKIMYALNQTGHSEETRDSIDLALCILEPGNNTLQFAGANRPLIRIREGELTEFRPDRMSIGIAPLDERPFTNNIIDTRPFDSFYLFSDGFADQFGEITGKKLKYNQFKQLLVSVTALPWAERKSRLECMLNEWKGNLPQNDDILVFGFQL